MHLQLDGNGSKHSQLARALKRAILGGQMRPGSKLPSTRSLAEDLRLSRNTVLRAYDQLRVEGLGIVRDGAGTYVGDVRTRHEPAAMASSAEAQSAYAARLRDLPPLTLAGGATGMRYDLQYGAPSSTRR